MNKRVEVLDAIGSVRYVGPLKHIEADENEIWVGIEWDDHFRGKHSGTINNF